MTAKPATVFLGEMTDPEVRAALERTQTIIIPTGSTEQHGPHGPLLTDAIIPNEVARRVAEETGALVGPPINYSLSYPHVGFTGVVHIRVATFMSLIEDLCASYGSIGFTPDRLPQRPLRQHLRHRLCLCQRRRADAGRRAGLPGQLLGRDDRR